MSTSRAPAARSRPDPKRCLLRAPSARGYPVGYTPIVQPQLAGRDPLKMGTEFGILRLRPRQKWFETTRAETALVLLGGTVELLAGGQAFAARRDSLFDDGPSTLHAGAGHELELNGGESGAELAVLRAPNAHLLPVRFTPATEVANEDRGAGLVQGACRRCVRTIFDYSTRPESQLVIGEVVNYPGRWSSYPPHHHPQPEIYHYRFTQAQGYGHAELADDIMKVRSGDTVCIPGGLDHAQVSAPGYGMYYLWIVRHLPRRPYRGFRFNPAHTWLLDRKEQGWLPPIGLTP
jgi:5-deoxy-glucuronate isomerase